MANNFGSTDMKAGKLLVCLGEAKDIKSDERFGLGRADPYAKMWLGSLEDFEDDQNCVKTKTMKNAGGNPVWDESFEFDIEHPGVHKNIHYITLHDKDTLTPDDPLEDLMIDIPQVLKKSTTRNGKVGPYVRYKVYYKGREKGMIELSLSMDVSKQFVGTREPAKTDDFSKALPARQLASHGSMHTVKRVVEGVGALCSTAAKLFEAFDTDN